MSVSVTNIMYEWRMLMQWAPVGKNQPVSKEPNKQTTSVLSKNTQLGEPTLGPQATTPFLADLLMPETFQCLTTKPLKNHSNNRKRPNNWLTSHLRVSVIFRQALQWIADLLIWASAAPNVSRREYGWMFNCKITSSDLHQGQWWLVFPSEIWLKFIFFWCRLHLTHASTLI